MVAPRCPVVLASVARAPILDAWMARARMTTRANHAPYLNRRKLTHPFTRVTVQPLKLVMVRYSKLHALMRRASFMNSRAMSSAL